MVYGTNGKDGRWDNEESATCRFQKRLKAPNPTLSATSHGNKSHRKRGLNLWSRSDRKPAPRPILSSVRVAGSGMIVVSPPPPPFEPPPPPFEPPPPPPPVPPPPPPLWALQLPEITLSINVTDSVRAKAPPHSIAAVESRAMLEPARIFPANVELEPRA